VAAYNSKTAPAHFLAATANQRVRALTQQAASCKVVRLASVLSEQHSTLPQVRERINGTRMAAVKAAKQRERSSSAGSLVAAQQQSNSSSHDSSQHRVKHSPTKADTAGSAPAVAAPHRGRCSSYVPWSELPADTVASKVAAATARHRALSAVMTPEQREVEERYAV
jgi:hypothetical protein